MDIQIKSLFNEIFVLILLTETENRYWICQKYVAWHGRLQPWGRVIEIMKKCKMLNLGDLKIMGIISSKISLSSLADLTGWWEYHLYSNFFP